MLNSILVWFRRDLRDIDHVALGEALRQRKARPLRVSFRPRNSRSAAQARDDRRVDFIRESLLELDTALRRRGGGLLLSAMAVPPRKSRETGQRAGRRGGVSPTAITSRKPSAAMPRSVRCLERPAVSPSSLSRTRQFLTATKF
jgi:hypothetical protein